MKITGGTLRGRKIKSLKGLEVRPTSEKIRQAFFNIIQNYIDDFTFVDLCCGTGIMSFEALSRGVNEAILIDNSKKSVKMAEENLKRLGLGEQCITVFDNVYKYVKLKKINTNKKLIIYFDPPYDDNKLYLNVMIQLDKMKFSKEVIFAVEHKKGIKLRTMDNIGLWKVKKYSDKCITLFATFSNIC